VDQLAVDDQTQAFVGIWSCREKPHSGQVMIDSRMTDIGAVLRRSN
jgi:hypothetical protein